MHDESRQTYGAHRAHAELVLGREMTVARCTVELIMRRLGLAGLPGRPRYRKIPNTPTASDLVNRDSARTEPNRLWLTDIAEHPTRRGQGLLRGGARRVLATRRGLVDRLVADLEPGQYTSLEFTNRLTDWKLQASYGSTGDCFDNAAIESSFLGRGAQTRAPPHPR